jgi:hypothetical protein
MPSHPPVKNALIRKIKESEVIFGGGFNFSQTMEVRDITVAMEKTSQTQLKVKYNAINTYEKSLIFNILSCCLFLINQCLNLGLREDPV